MPSLFFSVTNFKDRAYTFKVIFFRFMNIREKQILTSVIEIQKENWRQPSAFLLIINQQYLKKNILPFIASEYGEMYGVLFQTEA